MSHRQLSVVAVLALAAGSAGCPAATDPAVGEREAAAPAEEEGGGGGYRHAEDTGIVTCTDGAGNDPNGQLFWGELHLHTAYSLDAWDFGTNTTPNQAYLYAIDPLNTWVPGVPPIDRPLDFVAITDHAEFLSVTQGCVQDTGSAYYGDVFGGDPDDCTDARADRGSLFNLMGPLLLNLCTNVGFPTCQDEEASAWSEIIAAADLANHSCHFTALVGYEFSAVLDNPGVGDDYTNHRNVVFGPNSAYPERPFHSASLLVGPGPAATPLQLWQDLDTTCGGGPCEAVTIPHNSNLSNGESLVVWGTTPDEIELQQRYQVSAEIYQHKGASECPVDPAEPECDFEQLDPSGAIPDASYLRPQLGEGMARAVQAAQAAVAAADPSLNTGNPLKLGFVSGTDGHNGAPGNVAELTWDGHDSNHDDDAAERLAADKLPRSPGGLTGVWAPQNTRADIFAAIERRETYATSGPRISVRVQHVDSATAPCVFDPAGVKMGGTISWDGTGAAPAAHFLVEVMPDPRRQLLASGGMGRAPISAVQIVRVQTDANGVSTEAVADLAVGLGVGNVFNADPIHPAGDCVVATDPSFDPTLDTLWYLRVLQQETRRWSYDECRYDVPLPIRMNVLGADVVARCDDVQATVQERAWTSPIWFEPPDPAAP